MSREMPRVWINLNGEKFEHDKVQAYFHKNDLAPWRIEYMPVSEANALAAKAREDAFKEASTECKRQGDLCLEEPFNDLEGAQEWYRAAGIMEARALPVEKE